MAKSTGKFGSLSQLQPLQGDIATDILNREDQQFKHREEKRITDALTKKEVDELAAKNKKKADDYAADYEKLGINNSGFNTLDDRKIDLFTRENGTLQRFNDVEKRLELNPLDKEAIQIKSNLFKSSDNINAFVSGIVAKRNALAEGIANGTKSGKLNKDLLLNYDKMIKDKQFSFQYNDDGTVYVKNEGFDKNQDGKVDEMDKLSLEDVYDQNKLNGVDKFDLVKFATESKTAYGKKEYGTDNKEYVGFDMSKLESLKADIDRRMGADLATMTDEAKSLAEDWYNIPSYGSLTQTQFKDIKDNLAQRVIDTYETKDNNKTNWQAVSAGLAREKFNYEKSQDKKKEVKVTDSGNGGISVNTDKDGKPIKKGTDLWGKNGGWRAEATEFVTDVTKEKMMNVNGGKSLLNTIYRDSLGNIRVEATKYKLVEKNGESTWETDGVVILDDPTSLGQIAKAKGFKNVKDWSDSLGEIEQEQTSGGATNGSFNAESFYNNFKSGK